MPQITRPLPDTHPEFTVIHWPGFTEYRVAHYWLARDGSGRLVHGTCGWSWVDSGVLILVAWVVHAWFKARGEVGNGHGQGHSLTAVVPALATVPLRVLVFGIVILLTALVWTRCTQVLHESLLVFPTLGIQIETHRGHPLFPSPLSITRHFIPLSALEDVVLHEGFRRWNVRYYLAALQRRKRPLASALASAEAEAAFESLSAFEDVRSVSPEAVAPDGASDGIIEVHVAFENILPYFPVLRAVYLGVQETLFFPPIRVVGTETGKKEGVKDA